jgi:hypothetical protein
MNRSARETSHDLSCQDCATPMRHVATLPQFGAHPELRTFRCDVCAHVEPRVRELRAPPLG